MNDTLMKANYNWRHDYNFVEQYRYKTFADDTGIQPDIMTKARIYVDDFDRMCEQKQGIIMFGNPGTGKTFMASMIMGEILARTNNNDKDGKGRTNYIKGQSMLATMSQLAVFKLNKESVQVGHVELSGAEVYNYFLKCPLAIIDDFGTERQDSEWMKETMFDVIDSRNNLTRGVTIITTNQNALDWFNKEKPMSIDARRLYSRIQPLCPMIWQFRGKDIRAEQRASKVMSMMDVHPELF